MTTIILGGGNDLVNSGDGNDVIDAGGGNDTVDAGAGDDVIYQKDSGYDTVEGGAGVDLLVLDYSGEYHDWYYPGYGIWMDFYDAAGDKLSSGVWKYSVPDGTVTTQLGSRNYGVTFSGIERLDVTGTQLMDNLVGGADADVLHGGGGNDVLAGGGGNDILEGGDGDDGLEGGGGNDVLEGGDGNDLLDSSWGDDTLRGGNGDDTANYSAAPGAVFVDLGAAIALQDGYGSQDTLLNIERVVGSNFDDMFRGDSGNNSSDGGAGFDTVDYSAATGAVVVDLRPGTAFQDGMGGQDTLVSIERIVGSANNDVLSGDANNNAFEGGAGDDNLIGRGGDDTLNPGTGIDQVDGGDGTDRLVLDWSSITVASPADGILTELFDAHGNSVDDPSLAVEWVFHTAQSTDNIVSVRNVEQFDITGTGADDTLIGGALAGTLSGGAGNDLLVPGLGVNTLIGGPGNDVFVGSGAMFNGDQIIDLAEGDHIRFTDISLASAGLDFSSGILTISPAGLGTSIGIKIGDAIIDKKQLLVDKLENELTIDGHGLGLSIVSISPSDQASPEGDAGTTRRVEFTLRRQGDLNLEVNVDWYVRPGLANPVNEEDFSGNKLPHGSVKFDAEPGTSSHSQSKPIVFEIQGDDKAEPDEFYTVLLDVRGALLGTPSYATGLIRNDDDPLFSIDAVDSSKVEGTGGDTYFGFLLSRNGDPRLAADVTYNVLTHSAQHGYADVDDFSGALSGTVHFNSGATQVPMSVKVTADGLPEPDEVFGVVLTATSVGEIDPAHGFAQGLIMDDDDVTIGIQPLDANKKEGTDVPGGKPFTFEVTRSGNLSEELTTTYFVTGAGAHPADGADFEGGALPAGPVHFAANDSTPQIITLHVAADHDAEKDEGFEVILGPTTASLNPGRASGTIVDDDTSKFSIVSSFGRAEGNSGTTHFKFAVTRSGNTDVAQTINYSVSGDPSDVSGPFGGSITFAPSEAKQDIDIGVIGDTAVEPSEKFTVTLTDPHVAGIEFNNKQSIGTIVNDDPPLPPWPRPVFRGDPHLVSFDGLAYDFQAAGEFVLTQGAEGSGIEVQARTAPIGDLASNITAIATRIDGHWVTIDTLADQLMRIDGVVTVVPADTGFIDVGNGTIAFDGSSYTLIDPVRVSLIVQDFGNRLDMVMSADNSLAGTLTGLLGNFNGDTTDDLTLADGTVLSQPIRFADLYGSFANAWRVTQENSLFDYGPGATTDTYTDRDFPRMALTLAMLPAELISRATDLVDQAGITDPTVRSAAILDLAVTGDLSFLASAAIPVEPRATVEVVDTPAPLAVLSVASAATTQAEGDDGTTEFDFDLFRSGNTTGSLEVFYEIIPTGDHPASAEDFSGGAFPRGSLTFFDGQQRATIAVAVAGDTAAEHNETFAVKITVADADGSSVLIAVPAAPVTIENDDGDLPARLDINPVMASAAEGDTGLTPLTFEVIRSDNLTTETTVDYSVQGTGTHPAQGEDFDGGSYPAGTLNFLADETRKVITISVASDTAVECDEGFVVTLANAGNAVLGVATATGAILNDDTLPPPDLAIVARDGVKAEGDSGNTEFTFAVTRSGDTSAETSVDYVVAGFGSDPATTTDFGGAFPAGAVLFAVGEHEKLITVEVSGDTTVEPDEGFSVTLSNPGNGAVVVASAVGTIGNDDLLPPPTLRIAPEHAQQAEGDAGSTAFTFAITRSGDLSAETTVQYGVSGTATADDFAGGVLPSGTLAFAPGSAEQLLTIHVAGDHQIEPHEAFAVSLHDPVNGTIATGIADGVIFNDDTSTFKIGDAPARPPRSDAGAWERSWSHDGVQISHKADLNDSSEFFSSVLFASSGSGLLAGGDISAGDLGVSGQTRATSPVLQEIDGSEGLRFVLDDEANQIIFRLSRFVRNDDNTGFNEAGRLQLLDADGQLVKELFFYADALDGSRQVSVSVEDGFTQAIFSAGAQDGQEFVYGAYGNEAGNGFGASPFAAKDSLHGSDYLIDAVGLTSGQVDLLWLG